MRHKEQKAYFELTPGAWLIQIVSCFNNFTLPTDIPPPGGLKLSRSSRLRVAVVGGLLLLVLVGVVVSFFCCKESFKNPFVSFSLFLPVSGFESMMFTPYFIVAAYAALATLAVRPIRLC